MGDQKKHHYMSHEGGHMSWIFNDMINTRYDLFTHSKQISLVLNHYIFIVSEAQFSLDGKGHDIESLALGFFPISHTVT